MKTTHAILAYLVAGQATTDAICEVLHQPARVIEAFCQDLEVDGLADRIPIASGTLHAWRITELGRIAAKDLNLQTSPS